MLRDRLPPPRNPEKQAGRRIALLRDEMLSEIPALRHPAAPVRPRLGPAENAFPGRHQDPRRKLPPALLASPASLAAFVVYFAASKVLLFAWVGFLLGCFLPYAFASYRRTKRFNEFEELFPEAIDTLARAVRAGHAFTTALEMISNEVAEPVAGEFRKLFEEQKFGLPVRDALINLAERVPLVDVKFFVTAVMLQRETGGNLAEILDNLSYVIRERFKILRQVRVYTAQGRLTMMLLMGMPPHHRDGHVFHEPIVHPAAVHRSDRARHAGHRTSTLQTMGYFVIRKIIRIQV